MQFYKALFLISLLLRASQAQNFAWWFDSNAAQGGFPCGFPGWTGIFQCSPAPVTPTISGGDVQVIPETCQVENLVSLMDQAVRENKAIAPQWLQLAFHDAGTFDIRTQAGGANGCLLTDNLMREQPENHNLDLAIETLLFIKNTWGVAVSNADLIQFSGFFSAVRQRNFPGLNEFKMRELIEDFFWGRPDETNCNVSWTDNLPEFTDIGVQDTRNIGQRCAFAGREIKNKMMDRNGFTAREATALIGAHTIGLTRNVFTSAHAGAWVSNGADNATPEGGVFDNGYHRFLIQDIHANTVQSFAASRQSFDEDFPNWFRSNPARINHLDTDVVLAFPSQDTNMHPHFDMFTREFANNNAVFLGAFMAALQKMSRLGVQKTLSTPLSCSGGFSAAPPQIHEQFFFDLHQSLQTAAERLHQTSIQLQDQIAFLTTPVNIFPWRE